MPASLLDPHPALRRGFCLRIATAAAILLAGALQGCQEIGTVERQKSAFARYGSATLEGEDSKAFFAHRTAVLLEADGLNLSADSRGSFTIGQIKTIGYSAADAIDPRGYYITCAHCVSGKPMAVMGVDMNGKVFAAKARLVWKGDASPSYFAVDQRFDVAIIAIDRPLGATFTWSKNPPDQGDVLTFGPVLSFTRSISISLQGSAGSILKRSAGEGPTGRETILVHSGEGHPGDSGGPTCSPDGKLLGVNSAEDHVLEWNNHFYSIPPFSPVTKAVCPDPAWVAGIIDADYASHSSAKPPSQRG